MAHDLNGTDLSTDIGILERILIAQAEEYLKTSILKAMEKDIKKIATDSVKVWAEFRISLAPDMHVLNTNIHVQFIEKIVKTIVKESPIKITVKEQYE